MPDSKPTTHEGRRFVSNAIAFKTLQRRLHQELPAAQVEIAENMVLDALHGKEVDADHQLAGVAAHAVETRDALEASFRMMDARLIELGVSEEQRCAELDLMVAQSYEALKNAGSEPIK